MKRKYSCVVFDFGGVISHPQRPGFFDELSALLGAPADRLRAAYSRARVEYDRGSLDAEQYWKAFLAETGLADGAARIRQLREIDVAGWTEINEATVEAVRGLRGQGYRTAMISNMPWDIGDYIRGTWSWLDELFDPVIFSCELGIVKPEQGIFARALERLGLPAGECLFVDDSPANVAAAKAMGMSAVHFRSLEDLRGALAS